MSLAPPTLSAIPQDVHSVAAVVLLVCCKCNYSSKREFMQTINHADLPESEKESDRDEADKIRKLLGLVMDPSKSQREEKTVPLVSAVSSALALALINRQLAKGKSIEIPSLGIVIGPERPEIDEKKSDL